MIRVVLTLLIFTGCSTETDNQSTDETVNIDPLLEAQKPWEQEPEALLAQCERQPSEDLKTTCWVQAAAVLGRSGQAERATEICQQITSPTWKHECHFRAGEELGRAGQAIPALKHCAAAGHFGRYCLTHTAWNLPRDKSISPETDPAQVLQIHRDFMNEIDAALDGAGDGLEGEGHDLLMARFGYNLYVGSGQTNPQPSKLPGELGVVLRTGFAIECARLLDAPDTTTPDSPPKHRKSSATVEDILKIWNEDSPPVQGDELPESQRMGRYTTPLFTQIEEQEVSDWTPIRRRGPFGGRNTRRRPHHRRVRSLVLAATHQLRKAFHLDP